MTRDRVRLTPSGDIGGRFGTRAPCNLSAMSAFSRLEAAPTARGKSRELLRT